MTTVQVVTVFNIQSGFVLDFATSLLTFEFSQRLPAGLNALLTFLRLHLGALSTIYVLPLGDP